MAKGIKTGGRKRGTQNKFTRSVKEAFEAAFKSMQEKPHIKLEDWGESNPTEFYKLASKLIPSEVTATVKTQESAIELLNRGLASKK